MALETLPRLVASVASQSARLVNVSASAAPFEVSRPTCRDDLTLLRHVFMVTELPAWHRSRLQRLVKAPKLHMGDTGVAAAVLGLGAGDAIVAGVVGPRSTASAAAPRPAPSRSRAVA